MRLYSNTLVNNIFLDINHKHIIDTFDLEIFLFKLNPTWIYFAKIEWIYHALLTTDVVYHKKHINNNKRLFVISSTHKCNIIYKNSHQMYSTLRVYITGS